MRAFVLVLVLVGCTEKPAPAPSPKASASATTSASATASPSASATPSASAAPVHGKCTIKVTKTTVPVKNLDATMTKLEPELDAAYDHALSKNASIAGTVHYDAIIDVDGSFNSVVGRGPDVPTIFINDLTGVLRRAKLEPLPRAVEIRGTIVCAPVK